MKNILDYVDELYNQLKSVQPLSVENQNRLDKKYRLEFNYNSNHIEGNTLTYGETELLLIFDDTIGNHNMREYEETKAHDIAYRFIKEWAKDTERPLNEQNIKNLNEIILVRPYWKDAITTNGQNTRREIKVGNYKEFPNSVRLQNGEIFEYASPTDTPILMKELIDWYRSEEKGLHPITLATMLHYKFVRIHPFDDGNGRISRLLMNYVLLKHLYPPVIIKSSDKSNYLRALNLADVGNYEPLISYISEQAIWSLETSIKAAKGEPLKDTNDFIKEIELLKRKSSTKAVPKSPALIYDVFTLFNSKIWSSILDILKHFDLLFNENRNIYLVNNLPERFETKSVFNILGHLEKSTEPEKLKVFGHEIYTSKIDSISWEHDMLALRGADKPIDLKITVEIRFKDFEYNFRLMNNYNLIFERNKNYNESILIDEVTEIDNSLKKCLLAFVKDKID